MLSLFSTFDWFFIAFFTYRNFEQKRDPHENDVEYFRLIFLQKLSFFIRKKSYTYYKLSQPFTYY